MIKGNIVLWTSNDLTLWTGDYDGVWRTNAPNCRVSADRPRVVVAAHGNRDIIIADKPLLPGTVNRWKVKLLVIGGGWWDWVGVAPEGVNLSSSSNDTQCGWYLNTYQTSLYSGPPQRYNDKRYGSHPQEQSRQGAVIGVIMDTATGTLSFTRDGVDLGVAFTDIPLDKPLYPAAIFNGTGHSAEILPWEE